MIDACIVIGASTGGPRALAEFFGELAPTDHPILVVQHIQPSVVKMFAKTLERAVGRRVRVPTQEMDIGPGDVILAPGDFHMLLQGSRSRPSVRIEKSEKHHSCRPAVDPLFKSCARIFGPDAHGVVLTGLGEDGLSGAQEIKRMGGVVYAQDQKSSVAWGMPGAVVQAGIADVVAPPGQIAAKLNRALSAGSPSLP